MGFLLVLKAEVVRSLIIMRRYWFATLTGIVVGYGTMLALIYGFMYRGDVVGEAVKQWAERATTTGLGFIVGVFAFGLVGVFTQGLQGMARTGELEQVCMSPHGLVTNFLARSLVSAVSSVLSLSVMLWLVAMTVGGTLYANPLATAVLLTLMYANLIGFGFMVGGLVLVFKQTGQIAVLMRLALVALAMIANPELMEKWSFAGRAVAHVTPVIDASICLKLVLIQNVGVEIFWHPSFAFLVVNCVIWGLVGIACFKAMETWSRDKGTLGAY